MKLILLGISIILLGLTIVVVYSSSGLGYTSGTKIGLGISILGFIFSIAGVFKTDND
ncbi:hypothetical protein [Sporosarcina sp. NPDC096371]|uniref:hypothetical protein n=1 Tax=Sporosarcina sp. NPDC096371 TaxID=3364530 RepID=UPI003811C1C4